MLTGLQEEIDKYPELIGASKKVIMNKLNTEPGQVETWIAQEGALKVPKGDIIALTSPASQAKLFDWMRAESDEAKGFSLLYYAHSQFKVSDPVFRGTIQLLCDPLGIMTEAERDAILRLGERLQTRSEELFGRKITEEDFE